MPFYEGYRPGGPFPKPSMILMRGSPTATPDDPSETPRASSPRFAGSEPDDLPPSPSPVAGERRAASEM